VLTTYGGAGLGAGGAGFGVTPGTTSEARRGRVAGSGAGDGPVPAVSGVLKAAYSTLKVGVPALAEEGSLGGAAGSTLLSVSDGRSAAAALEQVKDRTQAIKSAATNGFVSG